LSSSPFAKLSTVWIALPSAWTANIKQDRTGSPSTSGARAAHTVLAADMRSGLSAILANGVDQRAARLYFNCVRLPIDY
jgi:hypothetical protein